MGRYRIQLSTPDLWKKVCAFHHAEYGGLSPRLNASVMDWKYLRNPYLKEPLVYVALCDDQVVGMRGVYGTCWEVAGQSGTMVIPSFSDTAIAREHRDSGLFEDLTAYSMDDLRDRDFEYVLNLTPSPAHYVVSVMTMGWSTIGSANELVWKSTGNGESQPAAVPAPALPERQRRIHDAGVAAGIKFKQIMNMHAYRGLDRNVPASSLPLSISDTPRPEDMAQLVASIGEAEKLRHVRDAAYLSWRYRKPCFSYRFLFWGAAQLDGYMVLQNSAGRRQVNIVDWEGRTTEIVAGMLKAVIDLGQLKTMATWGGCLSAPALAALNDANFRESAAKGIASSANGRFIAKKLRSDDTGTTSLSCDPLKGESWDMRMIYTEGT